VTFEEQPVSREEMARRIGETTRQWPWLVSETNGNVTAYAYAAPWKSRSAYRFAVECAIYVAPAAQRTGLGTRLYRQLLEELRKGGAHSVIAGIALPNPGSIALHEKLGFHKIGLFEEVGRKHDRWIDVGYWELVLEAPATGGDDFR
jgi:phosphinothricin acetyltransferase